MGGNAVIPKPIDANEARRRADLSGAGFETTTDLEVLTTSIGQPRAVEALKLGVGIDTDGYNIFVLGPPASGRHALAESFLEPVAATRPTPPDWCYVHNFEDARKPKLLELPAGTGGRLRRELEKLAEEVRRVLATALESDEYQTRREIVDEEYKTLTEKLFGEVEEEARKRGLALLRTPMGVAFAPLKENGEIAPPEEFQKLPEEERKRIQQSVEELQEQLRKSLDQAPRWERERQERLRQLNNEVVEGGDPPADRRAQEPLRGARQRHRLPRRGAPGRDREARRHPAGAAADAGRSPAHGRPRAAPLPRQRAGRQRRHPRRAGDLREQSDLRQPGRAASSTSRAKACSPPTSP